MRLFLKAAVLSATVLGVVAASSAHAGSHSACPKQGGTLVYGVKAEPPMFDLHGNNSYAVQHYVAQHYSTLLTFDWENFPKMEGDLANSWTVSDDGLKFTFNLHKGVKFHDGTPMTSADVKASYERIKNPPEGVASPRKALMADISSIETPDDHTVIFNLSAPNAFMEAGFASPFNAIYSKKDLDADPKFPIKNINGTGPYKLKEYKPGEAWITERYEDFHHDDNCLDGTIGYKISGITEPMLGGQIMAEWRGTAPAERTTLKEGLGDKINLVGPHGWMTLFLVSLNSESEAFQDKRVRQAVQMCLDRNNGLKQLAKITFTSETPAGLTLPGSPYAMAAEDLATVTGYRTDGDAEKKKAMALLKEAGYEGLKFTYSNRAVSHPYDHMAIWMISEWKKCGMNPEMISNPTSKFVTIRNEGGFDATIDWAPSFLPDPSLMLFKFLSDDQTGSNYSNYIDRELDDLYNAQKGELDFEKRKALSIEFEKKVLNDSYILPVAFLGRVLALDSKIKGFTIAPSHILNNTYRGIWLDE